MKIHIVLCSLALLLTSSIVTEAQQRPDTAPSAIETELLSLAKAWTDAINAKDRSKLDQLMAPEFTLHAWDNSWQVPKTDWMKKRFR